VPLRVVASDSSHAETLAKLRAAIEARGLTVLGHVDHAAGARASGLELEDEDVLIFGNAQAGTLLMQEDRSVGLELPLRILVWREGEQVFLAHRDPRELAAEFDLVEHNDILDRMAQLLDDLVREAI
jgi:uncharacterized protein (DUF302 family)